MAGVMQVPVYQQQTVAEPLPAARQQLSTTPDQFGMAEGQAGAAIAQALGYSGKEAENIVQTKQAQMNQINVTSNYQKWTDDAEGILGHTLSLKEGLAVNCVDNANKDFANLNQKYMDGLQNNAQRLAFTTMIDGNLRSYKKSIVMHNIEETAALQATTVAGVRSNSIQSAGVNQYDDDLAATNRTAYIHNLEVNGMGVGVKGQVGFDAEMRQYDNDIAIARTTSMLSGNNPNYQAADDYLDKNRASIDPVTYEALKGKAHTGAETSETYTYKSDIKADPNMHINGDVRMPLDPVKVQKSYETKAGVGQTTTTTTGGLGPVLPLNKWTLSAGDNPDVNGLTTPMKNATGSFLQQILTETGSAPVVTSGHRDPQHNKDVGGVPDSNHLTGNAVDLNLDNYTQAQRDQIVVDAHKEFGEVLWHDAGSGYHLHIADPLNTTQTSTTSTLDPTKLAVFRQAGEEAIAESNRDYAARSDAAGNAMQDWVSKNQGATADQVKAFAGSLNMPPTETASLEGGGLTRLGLKKNFNYYEEQGALQKVSLMIQSGAITKPGQIEAWFGDKLDTPTKEALRMQLSQSQQHLPAGVTAAAIETAITEGAKDAGYKVPAPEETDHKVIQDYYSGMGLARRKINGMIQAAMAKGEYFDTSAIRGWSRDQFTKTAIDAAGDTDYLFKAPLGSVYIQGKGYLKPMGG